MRIVNHIYQFESFPSWVIQGISTKYFGSMKDKDTWYPQNLSTFAQALTIPLSTIVLPHQTHTNHVEIITTTLDNGLDNTDGLVTTKKNIALGIVTADCLPVLFCDRKTHTIGIAHAGYKGLLKGVLQATIKAMESKTSDIMVGIGPGIGVCCYNVAEERIDLFKKEFPSYTDLYEKREGEYFLNLNSVAKQILKEQGIQDIEMANICTKDTANDFYSYRGDTKESFGEFMSIISIK